MTVNEKPYFDRVAIVGVGLIGGSLAISLREEGLVGSIVGVGRGAKNLETAVELGVIDEFTHDVAEATENADLLVLATPVSTVAGVVEKAKGSMKPGLIVTDVGSVKGALIDGVEPLLPGGVTFVPGHPIAGTEHSGVEAAFSGLFKNKKCILTPSEATPDESLSTIADMWRLVGSDVVVMDALAHDRVLAAISHLPHVIAYALVNTVADGQGECIKYSAGGFKDFTRIASSSPDMWRDIIALNREQILHVIEDFESHLSVIKKHVEGEDYDSLKGDFERAKRVRDSLVANAGEKTTDDR